MFDLVDLRLFMTFIEPNLIEVRNSIYPLLSLLKKYLSKDEVVDDPSFLMILYRNMKA